MKQLRDKDYVFDVNLMVTLFSTLLEFTLALHSQGCYHNDIKPDNVMILKLDGKEGGDIKDDNLYLFKMIDFGTFVFDYKDIVGFSPEYYLSSLRKFSNEENLYEFDTNLDRLKGEIFTIFRTFQECGQTKD